MHRQIFHITHIDNLPRIIEAGCLWCDAERRQGRCEATGIGYEHIKDRRMRRQVQVATRGVLGDYVPWNFCPRSVMLHSIWRGLVQGYDGGQENVLHLMSSTKVAVRMGKPCIFTNRHPEPPEAEYFTDLDDLDKLRWDIIESNSWGGERRPFKQAEFLVHQSFPWAGVLRIGVISQAIKRRVAAILEDADHKPEVVVRQNWYYD